MKNTKAAIRYAKALFDLAKERKEIDQAFTDMSFIHQLIKGNRELYSLLKSPVIKADTKVSILNKVFSDRVGNLVKSFIKIIADKGREVLIPEMAEEFVRMVKVHKNILTVEVQSAIAVDAAAREKIMSIVKANHTGEVEFVERVNPAIVGGVILKVGDRQIDASVSGLLRTMRKEFEQNPYEKQI
jgi:F-type H+-transporting ATPase subunit delta